MKLLVGMFFIIGGLIGIIYSIAILIKMKRIQKDCYKSSGVIEKIEYFPDPYGRTLPRYQVSVKYIDNFGGDYSGIIVLPLKDIKVGDSCKILIDKKDSSLMYFDEDDSFLHTYFFCVFLILLILLGLWLFMSDFSS